MQPSKKWNKILRVNKICAAACGANIFDKNYKPNVLTKFVIFNTGLFFLFSFYTNYIKLMEGFGEFLESFCMIGKGMQSVAKLASAIYFSETFCSLAVSVTNVYVEYEAKGSEYEQALYKCLIRVQRVLKMVVMAYLITVPIVFVTPLVLWAFDGRRVLALQFYIPGLDPTTGVGYPITLTVQLLFFGFGAFGNFAADMFFFELLAHFELFVDILRLKTKLLNELSMRPHSSGCMEKLVDVLKWHQTYSKFTEDANTIFFWINFLEVTTIGLSIVLLLVIIINGNWFGAYTFVVMEFSVLLMYCGMGTAVEVANEGISEEIYAIHWYNLTVDQQKIVKFMLLKSQSPKELTVGGIMPLSVSTALQVTKTIYSVFMMLLNTIMD